MLPDLFRLIGSDRYLAPAEVARAAEPHSAMDAAWQVYASDFGGFTGSTLDPRFHRLAHPAAHAGRLHLEPDTTVLVTGTDASLFDHVAVVKDVRRRVLIFTSTRGAEMLAAHGVTADLVVAEPHGRPAAAAGPAALVAAEWRTPAWLLAGVAPERLFVPSPVLTWGPWQAAAVAMAADAGAARIALLGIDAEGAGEAPLKSVLELLARLVPFTAFDVGRAGVRGAPKRGWVSATLADIPGTKLVDPLAVNLWAAPASEERVAQARQDLEALAPLRERARVAEIDELIAWREDPRVRVLVQEALGASILPRLWRAAGQESGRAARRPQAVRAVRELARQADTLSGMAAARRAA